MPETPDQRKPVDEDAIATEMQVLTRAFVERLPGRLDELADAMAAVAARPGAETLFALERAAHGISGSAGLFGFPELAQAAASLEETCRLIDDADIRDSPATVRPFYDRLVDRAAEI